ncbi:hypothetical protein [Verrucomicrobium sp. BvORR034]|uniref:hypothetical protein n=1 Tax=Verrucomicrobium sp. BvORR034 TaxID=1396418 RepID=UPI000679378A|nr:hypothetical protein [Verrucomicrobium sp. BvORR034]
MKLSFFSMIWRCLLVVYLLGCVAVLGGVVLFLVWQAVDRYPVPHVGPNPRLVGLLLVPALGVWIVHGLQRSRWSRVACVCWLALLLTLVVMDQFNFLLEYEVWLHRAGPDSGTASWKLDYGDGRTFWQEW